MSPLEMEPVVSFEVPVVSQPESASESKAAAAAVKIGRIIVFYSGCALRPGHRWNRASPGALHFRMDPEKPSALVWSVRWSGLNQGTARRFCDPATKK